MKEDKEEPIVEAVEEPQIEAGEEPGPEPVERPKAQAAEEPRIEAVEEPKAEAAEEPQIETVEEPKAEAVEEPKAEAVEEPKAEAAEEPQIETVEEPRLEPVERPKPGGDEEGDIEDGLELDRMEVKETAEVQEEREEEVEAEVVEPAEPAEEESARPNLLAMLAAYWIWIVAFLVGLSVVSAVLLFLLMPGGVVRQETKLGKRVHVVTASLGGEHYVRFNLYGPFRDSKGQAALKRGMPKIKNDLILSGGDPRVAVSIEEKDLYFLESHILDIVSKATGIPTGQLDLKGLSVTRYSDEAEIE